MEVMLTLLGMVGKTLILDFQYGVFHGIAAGFLRRVLDIEEGVEDQEGDPLLSAAPAVKQWACVR